MRLSPYIALLALLVTGVAQASPPLHPGQATRASVQTKLCSKRQVLKTRSIPATARLQSIEASVNGHWLQGWSEARLIFGLGGHGVVAQVTFTKKRGPAIVRLASAREGCVRVQVVIAWR